jgi:repressor LexA
MNTKEKIVEFLKEFTAKKGFAPSVREIAGHLGFKSTKAIKVHLDELAQKGTIKKTKGIARGISLQDVGMPILGRITAGKPTLEFEGIDGHFSMDKWKNNFLLRIKGDSMIGAGIHEGDLVVIDRTREPLKGNIVVALIEDETTVKKLDKKNGNWILKPENPDYPVIDKNFEVLGVVIGVIRSYYS